MRQISIKRRSNCVLYNVTLSVNALKYAEWLLFMQENHIPKIFSTGCFTEYKICRIIDENKEDLTVAVQYISPSLDHFEKYRKEFAPKLQEDHRAKFGDSIAAFRTLLQIVEEGGFDPEP